MSESIQPFGESRHDNKKRWKIYGGPHEVVRRVYIAPDLLCFTQDVADLVCAKANRPLWQITSSGQSQKQSLMRKYLAFFLRHHPWVIAKFGDGERLVSGARRHKRGAMRTGGLSFQEIARLLNTDHSTVAKGERRLLALLERNTMKSSEGLHWASYQLWKKNNDYGHFDVTPYTKSIRGPSC